MEIENGVNMLDDEQAVCFGGPMEIANRILTIYFSTTVIMKVNCNIYNRILRDLAHQKVTAHYSF